MKTAAYALCLSLALAAPALADPFSTGDSYGPRQPNGETDSYQPSVAEQTADNQAHRREAYQRLIEAGGCQAAVVPVEYATNCGTSETYRKVFGSPVMGSTGD